MTEPQTTNTTAAVGINIHVAGKEFRLCLTDQAPFTVIEKGVARPARKAEVDTLCKIFKLWMAEYDDLVEAGKFK